MKKSLAYAIILLILLNAMGYYFIFELKKQFIRKEMKALISSKRTGENYTILTIEDPEHNPEFRMADRKEFRYQGRLYDIIRQVRKGQSITFYCYRDKKEELLYAGLKKTRQNKIFVILYRGLVTQALPWSSTPPPAMKGREFRFLPYQSRLLVFSPVIPVPPPETA